MKIKEELNNLSSLKKLLTSPQSFDFFQAVRLLESSAQGKFYPVGYDYEPQQEVARFHSAASLAFPASSIIRMFHPNILEVSFLGLFGANGLLPTHYTELVIKCFQEKDTELKDFLDLLNHRLISLFYRAWKKYHFYVGYEQVQHGIESADHFTQALMSLVGNGTAYLKNRSLINDETWLYYAGFFTGLSRPAINLEALLSDYFSVPIKIKQFQGKWLFIAEHDQTRLDNKNSFNALGVTSVVGQRIWNIKQNFQICVGPLSQQQFKNFLPNGEWLRLLVTLTRRYVGFNLNFDVQLILAAQDMLFCCLRYENSTALSWNTWLMSKNSLFDAGDTILNIKKMEKTCPLST